MPRHGFARERQFTVESQTNDEAIFSFVSDESTLAVFPFAFRFRIKYALLNDSLSVSYEVLNTGDDDMYFSVGAHPAFKLPLAEGTAYQDYYLEFETPESTGRWPISADGLIETASQPLLENSATLPLTRELFSRDALVMKGLKSSVVSLRSAKTPHGLEFEFPGFPFLGLWAAKGGDFVCIEPWCGIADPVTTNQQLDTKEGINKLVKGEKFLRSWVVRVF
ncbi:MAG: aldose 1-epimerase family protein [Sphingobacteriales bacterium]|nr:MAG: aldose 1-epimerase family protein [Sphingobacteriales bacterium]